RAAARLGVGVGDPRRAPPAGAPRRGLAERLARAHRRGDAGDVRGSVARTTAPLPVERASGSTSCTVRTGGHAPGAGGLSGLPVAHIASAAGSQPPARFTT